VCVDSDDDIDPYDIIGNCWCAAIIVKTILVLWYWLLQYYDETIESIVLILLLL
jgi:hypothetical protein